MLPRSALRLVALLTAAVLVAGCLGETVPETDDEPETPRPRGNERVDLEELPSGPPEDWTPTLETAPEWRLGQWWQVRVTDAFVDGVQETTVVVAGAEPGWYLTGMPRDEFNHPLMVLHIPGIGQVRKGDLAWEIHDALFEPLRFPLQVDDSWQTHWQASPTNALVHDVSGLQATIHIKADLAEETITAEIVYDAEVGTIVRMDIPGYALLEVIDHGYGYEGIVTVPHEHALTLFSVRAAVVADFDGGDLNGVGLPIDTITIDPDFDRMSFALIALDLTGSALPVGAGVYHASATAPDGTTYELTKTPDEGAVKISYHFSESPGGDWELVMVAAGAGLVIIEGIGYHVFDIDTATGCLIDSDEHAHHGPGTEHPDTC